MKKTQQAREDEAKEFLSRLQNKAQEMKELEERMEKEIMELSELFFSLLSLFFIID